MKVTSVFSVSSNLSGASTGSYEVGIEVIPESQEWWPSKILKAQLWSLWTELEHWNGAPKLEIPCVFDSSTL